MLTFSVVWVRTDRNVTVLIEDAKTVKEKEERGKGKTVSRGFRGMKMGGVLGVPRALKSTTMMKE